MPVWAWIFVGVGAAIVVAAAAFATIRKRRTAVLRERFGAEYERTVERRGSRRGAESDLAERERRRDELTLRPLPEAARTRYLESWRAVQTRFVDGPEASVRDADALVHAVMTDRGYPMDDFEAQADVISVDHPDVVDNYRKAHAISEAAKRGWSTTTEDLRQALQHYRALFEELLEPAADEPTRAERESADARAESGRTGAEARTAEARRA
jgi:hypothetical protein